MIQEEDIPKYQIIQEWGKFLSQYDWHLFLTLTFRKEVKDPIRAKTYFTDWVSELKQDYNTEIYYFVAVEHFSHNLNTHLHGLTQFQRYNLSFFSKNIYVEPIWRSWFQKYGRAKIEIYNPKKGARYYVSKYLTKELCDYDFKLPKRLSDRLSNRLEIS